MMLLTWDLLTLLGITISFLIITLIFMLSYMFNNEFLKSWSKSEFLNVFITLILFGTLIGLVNLDIFKDNIENSKLYVNHVFRNTIYIQNSIISDIATVSLLGSLSFFQNLNAYQAQGKSGAEGQDIAESDTPTSETESKKLPHDSPDLNPRNSMNVQISLSPFVSPFLTSFTSIQIYSFIPITMIKLHELLITFVQEDSFRSFPILLCAGLFLRAFKFTRNGGNAILGIFLSLYFFLPVIYLFNQSLVNVLLEDDYTIFDMGDIYSPEGMKDIDISKLEDIDVDKNVGKTFITSLMNIIIHEMKTLTSTTDGVASVFKDYKGFGNEVFNMISPGGELYKFVLRFMIEGFVLPYIAIIISLGLAKEFAMVLGSNVDFSMLVRII